MVPDGGVTLAVLSPRRCVPLLNRGSNRSFVLAGDSSDADVPLAWCCLLAAILADDPGDRSKNDVGVSAEVAGKGDHGDLMGSGADGTSSTLSDAANTFREEDGRWLELLGVLGADADEDSKLVENRFMVLDRMLVAWVLLLLAAPSRGTTPTCATVLETASDTFFSSTWKAPSSLGSARPRAGLRASPSSSSSLSNIRS
jgi:hypothetical protein